LPEPGRREQSKDEFTAGGRWIGPRRRQGGARRALEVSEPFWQLHGAMRHNVVRTSHHSHVRRSRPPQLLAVTLALRPPGTATCCRSAGPATRTDSACRVRSAGHASGRWSAEPGTEESRRPPARVGGAWVARARPGSTVVSTGQPSLTGRHGLIGMADFPGIRLQAVQPKPPQTSFPNRTFDTEAQFRTGGKFAQPLCSCEC
jgi:hypothetical protein